MDWEAKAGRRAKADSSDVAAARELVAELKATYDIETTDQTVALAITLLAGRRGLSTSAARDTVARSQEMRS
jgi:predicted secreted protein